MIIDLNLEKDVKIDDLLSYIIAKGKIEFCSGEDENKELIVDGTSIKKAEVFVDTSGEEKYMIYIKYNDEASKKIREVTSKNSTQILSLWLDDKKIASEKNSNAILYGEIQIGCLSYNEAKNITNTVLSGELPISLFVKKCSKVAD